MPLRVAVLDDELDACASLCAGLSLQGLEAVPFTGPDALWSSFCQRPFHAFVLDWALDPGNSEWLIRALRMHADAQSAPVFLLSGNITAAGVPLETDLATAIQSYQLEFRPKPYSCVMLARELEDRLSDTRLLVCGS